MTKRYGGQKVGHAAVFLIGTFSRSLELDIIKSNTFIGKKWPCGNSGAPETVHKVATMTSNAISGMLGTIHGELRWIFALVALSGIGLTGYRLVRDRQFSSLDGRWALAYSMLLDLQAVYGILLILYLSFSELGSLRATFNWVGVHPLWMLAAVIVGHSGSRWKHAPDRTRLRAQLGVYVVSLGLISVGVITSPLKGWM